MYLTSADITDLMRGNSDFKDGRPFDPDETDAWRFGWTAHETFCELKQEGRLALQ